MSEPSRAALRQLQAMLLERGSMLGEVKVDGDKFWVLCSPELMIQLIERADEAERKYAGRQTSGLGDKVFDFLNDQNPDLLAEIIRLVEGRAL